MFAICKAGRPNGWRLSCGAKHEGSQTEFYYAACKTFSGFFGAGRRQLQALVRAVTYLTHLLGVDTLEATTKIAVQLRSELRRLACSAYHKARVRLLAMVDVFDAFMDESHNGIYCVGGVLGRPGGFERLWGRWEKMMEPTGITVLHMADCEAGHGDFVNMSEKDRDALQRKAIGIIRQHDVALTGIVAAVEVEPYDKLRSKIEQYRRFLPGQPASGSLGDPYFLAFQQAIESVCSVRIQGLPPSDNRIGFTFDRNKAVSGRALAIYDILKESKTVDYAHRLGQIAFDDKRHMIPLQAADTVIYEAFRYLKDLWLRGGTSRWQWKELQPAVRMLHVFREPELLKLVAFIEKKAEERSRMPSLPEPTSFDDA
jgi:hypothetical protein